VPEHGRAVTRQMLNELDRSPLGPAEQLLEPPLRAAASRGSTPSFEQVEGEQHRLMSPALAPQRMKVRRPVVLGDHRFTVDQERLRLDAVRGINYGRQS
jgi:hypothetical protein